MKGTGGRVVVGQAIGGRDAAIAREPTRLVVA